MRKIILSISLLIALLFSGTSCSDYLNIVPEGTPSMDNAFSNRINSFKFLHTCYSYLPKFCDGSSIGFLAGDEHWLLPKGTGFIDQRIGINAWEIGRGSQNSNNPYMNYWDGGDYGGSNLWIAIRDCNIFLENIHKPYDLDDYERERWISEVKFLKAYYHFFLFQLYGPIPIVDKNLSVDASSEEVRIYREPVDSVVKYISGLLDNSMDNLPLKITDETNELGRITQPIAKAVKAQLLLLSASDLFNGNSDFASLKDGKGRFLFPADKDDNKWKLAADAALDAIQTADKAGHKLYYFNRAQTPTISDATVKLLDIKEAVTERWNKEIVWGSTWNVTGLETQSMAKTTKGNYWEARSVLGPTLTVAEAFYSNHGIPLSEEKEGYWAENYSHRYEYQTVTDEGNNKYYMELNQQTAKLHFNREPRFYASLAFDRGTWYGKGFTDDSQANLAMYRFRRKEVSGLNSSEDYSYTGYLNKKVCSYQCSLTKDTWTPYRYSFPIIRLSDVYLMYAEALNETLSVPTDEVYKYIDLVRARAGLEGVKDSWTKYAKSSNKPNTREGMREIIRMERLNELAGEGKRFWDLRRWKVELPTEIRGWNAKGETPETFYRVNVLFTRPKFTYKDYLWPLKVESLQRNPNLVQNSGW